MTADARMHSERKRERGRERERVRERERENEGRSIVLGANNLGGSNLG